MFRSATFSLLVAASSATLFGQDPLNYAIATPRPINPASESPLLPLNRPGGKPSISRIWFPTSMPAHRFFNNSERRRPNISYSMDSRGLTPALVFWASFTTKSATRAYS